MSRPVLPNDTSLNLYVPSGRRPLDIVRGSAIVGLPRRLGDEDKIEVYYEGAVHGQHMGFEEKIQHAAGRMVHRAPTVAFGFYDEDDLVRVGRIARSDRLRGWIVTVLLDRQALELWAGEGIAIGGSTPMRERAAGIAWGQMSPSRQMEIQMRAQAGGNLTQLVLDAI